MFGWFRKKDIQTVVHARRKVSVCGVDFVIKRIDVLAYLSGAKVLHQAYDTYKMKGTASDIDEMSIKKLKEHYTDVICSGVVSPMITRKQDGQNIWIEELFTNWELTQDLYKAIVEFSYGKKKLKQLASLAKSS